MNAKRFALALLLSPLTAAPLAPAAVAAEAPAQQGAVTVVQLADIVKGLGYEVKLEKDEIGDYFTFAIEDSGLTIRVVAEQSESGNYIWFKTILKEVSDGDNFKGLLESNLRNQPAQFYIDDKVLRLAVPLENRAVNPQVVRRVLDVMIFSLVNSQDLWLAKAAK